MDYIFEDTRIYLRDDSGKVLAEITFDQKEEGVFSINHTFVDDSLRGQGIASKLVELAVEKIKDRGGKVVAQCSYAKSWLEKHPQC